MARGSLRLVTVFLAIASATIASPAFAEPDAHPSVVFAVPSSPELEASLRDALTAQLSGSAAEVVFEKIAEDDTPLRKRVAEARSLAGAHDAVGVFWLDPSPDGDWLIYLVEPKGERVLIRRVAVEAGATAASVEAVAVIVRESTEALLAGASIGLRPIDLPEPAAPSIAPSAPTTNAPPRASAGPAPRRRSLFVSIGYVGDAPAEQVSWQSGARLGVGLRSARGLYAGAGVAFFKQVVVGSPNLAFHLDRVPLDLDVGFAFGHGRLVPAIELRGAVEIVRRQVDAAAAGVMASADSTRAALFFSPRFRLEYTLTPVLGIYLGGGADVALNAFSYVSREDGQPRVLLEPRGVRPAAELGLLVWP